MGTLVAAVVGTMGVALAAPDGVVDRSPPMHSIADALTGIPEDGPCLRRDRLASHVTAWLGEDEVDARIQVRVTAGEGTVTFGVLVGGELTAERVIEPAPRVCEDLHAATGLAIAFALDAAVLEKILPALPEPARAEPEPVPAPEPERPPARVGGGVELRGLFAGFILPRLAGGGSLAGELSPRPWLDLLLEARALAAPAFGLGAGEVATVLTDGTVLACPARRFGPRVRMRLCTGAAVGVLFGRGRGYVNSYSAVLPRVAVVVSPEILIDLGKLMRLDLALRAEAPVVRPGFEVLEAGETRTRRLPPAGFVVGVGPALRWR